MVGPALLGWIADLTSVQTALRVNALAMIAVVAYFGVMARETKHIRVRAEQERRATVAAAWAFVSPEVFWIFGHMQALHGRDIADTAMATIQIPGLYPVDFQCRAAMTGNCSWFTSQRAGCCVSGVWGVLEANTGLWASQRVAEVSEYI